MWQSWTFWKNVFWFIKLKNWLNIWSLLFIEFVLWMFIICCVPVQIPYLEKTLVLRCGSKCFSANQIASTISRFFACWYIFRKAKTCFKWFLGAFSQKWTMTKRDSQNLHYETLTFYEWIHKLRWFLTCWCWCIVLYLLAIYHKNVITYIQVC